MTSPRQNTTSAVEFISQAVKAGSLPSNTGVRWSGPHITVTIDTRDFYHPDYREGRLMAELFATTFPGGKTRRLQCISKPRPRWKVKAKDRMEYRASLGNGNIVLRYVAEHECQDYRGSASSGSIAGGENPVWVCCGCGRQLNVTECRKLGLIPPLVRGRKP
jgi:hypothetical protein